LLDDDVLAVAHRGDRVLAVEAVRRGHPHRFDVLVLAERLDALVRLRPRIALFEAAAHLRVEVGTGHQVDLRHRRHRRHHAAGTLAETGNGHAQLTRAHAWTFSRFIPKAASS